MSSTHLSVSSRSSISPAAPRNGLLAALPAADLARLRPQLEVVEVPLRAVLHRPNEPIDAVYFPERGWISLVAMLESGDAAEVGIVGPEGVLGLPVFHTTDRSPFEAMSQGGCTALRLEARAFTEEVERSAALRRLLLRYSQAYTVQVAWTAACNGRHPIGQRLARWMLMAHDRSEGADFPMTHEFLSMMLGVRRAGVSVTAGTLQKAGLIRYERGRMSVIDRPGLEAVACECHVNMRREFRRLLGCSGDNPGRAAAALGAQYASGQP
jgi:CRP-like cAMP-binding protein